MLASYDQTKGFPKIRQGITNILVMKGRCMRIGFIQFKNIFLIFNVFYWK